MGLTNHRWSQNNYIYQSIIVLLITSTHKHCWVNFNIKGEYKQTLSDPY